LFKFFGVNVPEIQTLPNASIKRTLFLGLQRYTLYSVFQTSPPLFSAFTKGFSAENTLPQPVEKSGYFFFRI